MLRRATDDDRYGSAFLQPEASRPTQDWIIVIIPCEEGPGKYHLYFTPDFQHYTRE
jgi:hypothetical protein